MEVIGVDVGGTKISAARVSGSKVGKIHTIKTKSNASKQVVINQIIDLIDSIINKKIKCIGVCVPGPVDSKKRLVLETPHIKSWKNVSLKSALQRKFKRSISVNNDANCFAHGEKHFGKGKKYKTFVGITLGTGVGGGIIINNEPYEGATVIHSG